VNVTSGLGSNADFDLAPQQTDEASGNGLPILDETDGMDMISDRTYLLPGDMVALKYAIRLDYR